MNFKYITKAFAVATLFATAISCSDDEWEPGPDVAPNCLSAYFEPLNNYNLTVEPDDSRLIPITIGRGLTDDAATLNLIVNSCPEGVVVPSSVSFEAGEQTQTIHIDIENMASKSSGTISLSIPEEMTSPYAAGITDLNLNVTVSGKWEPVAKDADVVFSASYAAMKTDLFMLDGTQNFKLPNFLGSGLDFTFTVNEPGSGDLSFVPLTNFKDVHERWGADYEYNGWFLYNYETESYAAWSPDGSNPGIGDMEFDSDYSYINFTEGVAYFSTYTTYTDGSANFVDVYIYFDPIFNPFATSGEGE